MEGVALLMKWYCMIKGCGYVFPDDEEIEIRKIAHQQMHTMTVGRASKNIIVGKPSWKLVEVEN